MYLEENSNSEYIKYFKNEAIKYFEKDIKNLVKSWNVLAYIDTLRQLWKFKKAENFYKKNKDEIIKNHDSDIINAVKRGFIKNFRGID